MMDYKLTEEGLYAYEYPRASVTADAVLFAQGDEREKSKKKVTRQIQKL